MDYTNSQSAALPTYTLHYTTIPQDGKSPAIGGKTNTHKLELPRELDLLEAAFWASVILTEMSNNPNRQHLLFGTSYLPTLEVRRASSIDDQICFSRNEDPLQRNYFYVQPVSESLAVELKRHRMNAHEIWGADTSAITWGVRDLEINAQYPGLNRKLPEKPQAFLDLHNGDLAAAIKTSRLIDPWQALTWFRSTQQQKKG